MKIKLMSEVKGLKAGSVVECEDAEGQTLIDAKSAQKWDETAEKADLIQSEVRAMTKEIESKEATVPVTKEAKIEVRDNPKGEIKSLGELFQKIATKEIAQYEIKAPTGINETTTTEGGFLVTHGITDKIYGVAIGGSIIYDKCEKVPVGDKMNGMKIPYMNASNTRTSTPRGYWVAEGGQKTATKFTFGQWDADLGKLIFYVPLTDEIMQDRAGLEAWVMGMIRGKLGWMLDDAILNLAAATSGMVGVFDATANAFKTTPVGTASTGAYLNQLTSGVMPSLRGGAEWYMSNARWQTLVAAIGTGTTVSTQPILNLSQNTINGQKVNVMEQMAASGSAGDILYGNFPVGYVCLQKGGIQVDISKDIRFDYDETVLRFVLRVAGRPVIATQTPPDNVPVAAFSTHS